MKLFMISLIFTLLSQTPAWASNPADTNKDRDYSIFDLKIEVNSTSYKAFVYRPTKLKIKALLIISPTIKGMTSIEESNAQYFSKRGYVVIATEQFYTELNSPNPDPEKLNADYYKPALAAISFINAVDQKLNLPETLPIFALGASQGGIFTLIIAAHVPRIKGAWFAVTGGDLPHIYAYSDVEELAKFRKNHMRILGMTKMKDYEDYLRLYLKNDPTISCKEIKVPFHQTIALRDTSVPTSTQELLVDECPPHDISRKNMNHAAGTVTTVLERQQIMDYFDDLI
ncbi:hypothetical protein SHI21_14735 [Bacteriovorax sp. PP10]|uniref:Uncharacterized protein n=1 Tax=Bacteriovorax antarcticus TaxID=3088717 RepID=A0ABU5VWW8_9BACT|nr:hypothetical protein [Bacteriovorax sp. PP10]MEA9357481.1 hypothetical protein [Bacteriovorax sp. PP10]